MKILERSVYVGPSLYAHFPVIRLEVDLGPLEEWPTVRLGETFISALLAACEAGLVRDRALLDEAALRLLPHQSEDGSFDVEPHNPIGSPVTYGTSLATYFAWKALSVANRPEVEVARDKAALWLDSQGFAKNTPQSVALLFYQLKGTDPDYVLNLHHIVLS